MDTAVLARFLVHKFDEITAILGQLDDDAANAAPDMAGANSPYQILTHCMGMSSEWVFRVILGREITRDREAEFHAAGNVSELLDRARAHRTELAAALAQVQEMDAVCLTWPRTGEPPFWSHEPAGVLLHVFEELCQHLGHLEVTRDLNAAAAR